MEGFIHQEKKINLSHKHLLAIFLVLLSITFSSQNALASEITVENLLLILNKEREIRGVPTLIFDPDLQNAALMKSRDMINRDYFDHYAFGVTPWDFITNAGYDYDLAGENLAMDFRTSEGVVNAWMNSPRHRDNILNPEYKDVGLGIVKGEYLSQNGLTKETTMVTNMFGRHKSVLTRVLETVRETLSWY